MFFFDEVHLLFNDRPAALLNKIEQVVRWFGPWVGVYFRCCESAGHPDTVLGQLGNWVQHRAACSRRATQKAVKTAAQTMRPNPGLDIEAAITELGVGEALVSLLDPKGRPMPTERAFIVPPASRIGPATDAERQSLRQGSPLASKYETAIDRESAYEVLAGRAAKPAAPAGAGQNESGQAPAGDSGGGLMGSLNDVVRIDRPARRQARRYRPDPGQKHRPLDRARADSRHIGVFAGVQGPPLRRQRRQPRRGGSLLRVEMASL